MEGNNSNINNPTTPVTPTTPTGDITHHILDSGPAQQTIRTYESDIAEALSHKKTSQVSINLAQVERQRTEAVQIVTASAEAEAQNGADEPRHIGRNIFKIILSLILIAAGAIGGYYLYTLSPLAVTPTVDPSTPAAPATLMPAIITPDQQKTVNIQDKSDTDIQSMIAAQAGKSQLRENQVMDLIFYEVPPASSTSQNQTASAVRVTASAFIAKLGIRPPDVLVRSISDSWMFGLHQTQDTGTKPFIILKTTFFQNAFSGMLKWEPTMADDIARTFSFPRQAPVSMATVDSTTGTSTDATQATMNPPTAYFAIRGGFIDKVIQNKDVREFKDEKGSILFLYAFIDNNTLVISQEESTLGEVITRFEKKAYIR